MTGQGTDANYEPMMTRRAPNSTERSAFREALSRVWVAA